MAWPQDRTRAETLDHLIELSRIQNADLQHVNLADLRHLEEAYRQYTSIRPENREKNLIVYNSLTTEDERNIFKRIHSNLSQHTGDDVTAILIDSIPCDKRSFFLLCVSITLDTEITYIVFRRVLRGTHARANKMSAYTAHQFLMSNLGLDYDEADRFFKDHDWYREMFFSVSCSEMLQKIISRPLEKKFDLLILDEYTIPSPWYVLWLYWIAKYHRIPILFFGDKAMLAPIQDSQYCTKNNYIIVEILAHSNCYSLNILDTEYRRKVAAFKEILDPTENIDLMRNPINRLIELFGQKFQMEEDFKAIFLAQFHANLYQRAYRILDHVRRNGIEHDCIPYRIEGTEVELSIDTMRNHNTNRKFLEFLLLIKDFIYTYAPSPYEEKFVRFENIDKVKGIVTVTDIEDGRKYQLSRVPLEKAAYVTQELNWLREFERERSLCQYPLRLLCKTYHSVQGLTMPADCKVELEMSCCFKSKMPVRANAVYVGLSSVTSEEQLGKFHITDFGTRRQRPPTTELAEIAKGLRYVPRDDILANSDNIEDLKCHFVKFLNGET